MEYMLLEIQDKVKIDGESKLKDFVKFVELYSYSHGVSNAIQMTTSNTGRTTGRPNIQEFTVTKNLDSTSPLLNFHCAKATDLGTTKIHLVRQDSSTDDNHLDYMIYELSDTIVSSVSVGGGGGSIPVETVSLNFSKIKWTYNSQKKEIGKEGQVVQFWDQTTNNGG